MLGFARTGHPHCHGWRKLHSPHGSRDAYDLKDHAPTWGPECVQTSSVGKGLKNHILIKKPAGSF